MSSVVSRNAIVDAASRTNCNGISRISSATAPENETAPTADARNPRNVSATWMVARNREGSSIRRSATCAERFPSLAS